MIFRLSEVSKVEIVAIYLICLRLNVVHQIIFRFHAPLPWLTIKLYRYSFNTSRFKHLILFLPLSILILNSQRLMKVLSRCSILHTRRSEWLQLKVTWLFITVFITRYTLLILNLIQSWTKLLRPWTHTKRKRLIILLRLPPIVMHIHIHCISKVVILILNLTWNLFT